MLPRHPMTKGRIRLSPWNPIEQGAFLLPPLHPRWPTLRGLDARQPYRGWIAICGGYNLFHTHYNFKLRRYVGIMSLAQSEDVNDERCILSLEIQSALCPKRTYLLR